MKNNVWVLLSGLIWLAAACSEGGGGGSTNASADSACVLPAPNSVRPQWRDGKARITWSGEGQTTDVFDDDYIVQRQRDDEGWLTIERVNADTLVYTDAGVGFDEVYSYRVKLERDGDCRSGPSNVAVLHTPPRPVSFLAVTETRDTSITLAWVDPNNRERAYLVYRAAKDSAYDAWKKLLPMVTLDANATSYTDTTVEPNQGYIYWVVGISEDTLHAPTQRTLAWTVPRAPSNLAVEKHLGQIHVRWTHDTPEQVVFRAAVDRGEGFEPIAVVERFQASVPAQPNTLFTFRVSAQGPGGDSHVREVSLGTPPLDPWRLWATSKNVWPCAFAVHWNHDNTTATTAVLHWRRGDGPRNRVSPVTSPYCHRVTGDPNQPFSYELQLVGPGGTSKSIHTTAYWPPNAPGNLSAELIADRTFKLSWDDTNIGLAQYRISRQGRSGRIEPLGLLDAGSTTFQDNTRGYYGQLSKYTVTPVGPGGTEGPSGELSVRNNQRPIVSLGAPELTAACELEVPVLETRADALYALELVRFTATGKLDFVAPNAVWPIQLTSTKVTFDVNALEAGDFGVEATAEDSLGVTGQGVASYVIEATSEASTVDWVAPPTLTVASPLHEGRQPEVDTPKPVDGQCSTCLGRPAAITAGKQHHCYVRRGARDVYCSGSVRPRGFVHRCSGEGEPCQSNDPLTDVEALASTDHAACGLTAAGEVWCWGEVSGSQYSNNAERVCFGDCAGTTPENRAVALTAGAQHVCALTATGEVFCWGGNESGQLGDLTTTPHNEPVAVCAEASGAGQPCLRLQDVRGLAAGRSHTCALTQKGGVICWGLLDGVPTELPQKVCAGPSTTGDCGVEGALTRIKAIAGGGTHTCGLTTQNTLVCWGDNTHGQLGDGTPSTSSPFPVPVSNATGDGDLANVVAFSLGDTHSCAVDLAGALYCWGNNDTGAVVPGGDLNYLRPEPLCVSFPERCAAVAIQAGPGSTCSLSSSHRLVCWGELETNQINTNLASRACGPFVAQSRF